MTAGRLPGKIGSFGTCSGYENLKGLMQMNWQLLWFVLAGFVLGFAVSTLWEWLYYRGLRQRALVQQRAATVRPVSSEPSAEPAPAPTAKEAEAPIEADYRSPAVFIEGEEPVPVTHPSYEPLAAPWTPPATEAAPVDMRGGSARE